MSDFHEVKKNLVEPQGRTFLLAPSKLDKEHLPRKSSGDLTFLLSLSQKGAEGNGDWEAYRAAFEDHITSNSETLRRMKGDQTTKKLMDRLIEDYKRTEMEKKGPFFDNNDDGLQDFLLRYLHYVLFGLDPFDEKIMAELNNLHYDRYIAVYYLEVFGNAIQNLRFRDLPKRIERVAKIYEESPSLSDFQEGREKYKKMTKHDLALLSVSIMAIAGLIGPKTLVNILLGYTPLPSYDGQKTGKIDVVKVWDQIDFDDRDEVKNYVYECGRLRHPVSNTHKIATSDFTIRIGSKDVTFRRGTIIFIPMQLASLDESVYGEGTFNFNHRRENLLQSSTIFHSFGEQTNGRICPAKKIVENMAIDILIALGKSRRQAGRSLVYESEYSRDYSC